MLVFTEKTGFRHCPLVVTQKISHLKLESSGNFLRRGFEEYAGHIKYLACEGIPVNPSCPFMFPMSLPVSVGVARLQDARLALLTDLLRQRDEAQEQVTDERLDHIYSKHQTDRETKLHKIHKDYIRCKTTAASAAS